MKKKEKEEAEQAEPEEVAQDVEEKNLPATIDATRGMLESIGKMDFAGILELGDTLVKTGFLPDSIKTGAQAAAIILKGAELHVPPMQSLETINIIKGKPAMAAQLMLGLCRQRIRGFKASRIESTEETCTWLFERPGNPPHKETFDTARAEKMKTMEKGKTISLTEKFNWRTMPKVMREWRCISAGLRLIAPDIIMGLYTPEELDPSVKIINAETGEIELAEVIVKENIEDLPNGSRTPLKQKDEPIEAETEPTVKDMLTALNALPKEDFYTLCEKCTIDPGDKKLMKEDGTIRTLFAAFKKGIGA